MRKFVFEKRKYGFELLMDLHKFETNPNAFFDPNPQTGDFFEIMMFQKAKGSIVLNGQSLKATKNSFFFICPFQKKSCHIPIESVKGFHLVFQNDFLSNFFDDKLFAFRLQYFYNSQQPQYLVLQDEEYGILKDVLNEIINEINNYQKDSPHIIRSLLYFSLSKLNRLYCQSYNISPETQSNSGIYEFKELLESHIRKIHSVGGYCDLLRIDRYKLNRIVKGHMGCSAKEIIDTRLLNEIKMELRYSDKTIAEISHALHFSEPNNLTRFFKKLEGMNPNTYRKKAQNDSIHQ
ncbi:MAG: helix-turn-helix domain-containing protein [Bacteroidota bacterium]